MAGDDVSMTLVLGLSAVERLTEPTDALADAARWSTFVGIVGNDPATVQSVIDRIGAEPDFVSGTGGTAGSLSAVRQRFTTERHVFVSIDESDRATASALGWEVLTLEEAASKAGWPLDSGGGQTDSST